MSDKPETFTFKADAVNTADAVLPEMTSHHAVDFTCACCGGYFLNISGIPTEFCSDCSAAGAIFDKAKAAINDEGVFSPDQIALLQDMIDGIAYAMLAERVK